MPPAATPVTVRMGEATVMTTRPVSLSLKASRPMKSLPPMMLGKISEAGSVLPVRSAPVDVSPARMMPLSLNAMTAA